MTGYGTFAGERSMIGRVERGLGDRKRSPTRT